MLREVVGKRSRLNCFDYCVFHPLGGKKNSVLPEYMSESPYDVGITNSVYRTVNVQPCREHFIDIELNGAFSILAQPIFVSF